MRTFIGACVLILAIGTYIALFDPPVSAPDSLLSVPFPEHADGHALGGAETGSHSSEVGADRAPLSRSSGVVREDPASEDSFVAVAPQWQSDTVKTFVKDHPNNPLKFMPATATQDQIAYLEQETEAILSAWQRERDRLLIRHGDNILAFCSDPDVIANDKDRVTRLRNLVLSLWPDCGLEN